MLESLKRNRKGILIMLLASACACTGQTLWKLSASQGLLTAILGFGFYGVGALFMIIAYRYGSVMVLQPVMSMNYVISLVIGALVFHESVGGWKIPAVLLIILGVVLIGAGESK